MRHFTHISPSSNLFSGPSQMGQNHSSRIMFLMKVLEHSPIFFFEVLDLCLPLDDPWASTNRALYSGDEIISDFSLLVFCGTGIIEEKLE